MAMFPLPSISELFSRSAPQQPLTAAQVNGAGGANPGNVDANTTVPNANTLKSDGSAPAFPLTKEGEASPLSNFQDIWKSDPNTVSHMTLVPEITADPAAMYAAAQKMDFSKVLNPDMVTKAMGGDKDAFLGVINSAVQAGYAQATIATVNITKAALTKQAEQFETKYAPSMLRNASISDATSRLVKLSDDPAAAPVVAAIRNQLASKFPTASADEIAQQTEQYMQQFAEKAVTLAGGRVQRSAELQAASGGPLARKDEDWSAFFDMDASATA